jgi:tetratricopeptide (TPR) repeat protein
MKSSVPHSLSHVLKQASTHIGQGQPAHARALLLPFLEHHEHHADAWYLMGISCYLLNEFSDACAAFKKGIDYQPKQPDFHTNLGLALQANMQLDEAELAYKNALVLNPTHIDALFNLATLQQERQVHQEAISLYSLCLKLRPQHAKTHYNLGTAYSATLQHGEAIRHFRQAVDLSPNHTESWIAMASACHALNETKLAQQCLDSALRLAPENPAAHMNRALILLAEENFESGWPEFEWRWSASSALRSNYRGNRPLWLGQISPKGLHLLVHCEQGFGDTLQCARYFEMLQNLGIQLTVLVEHTQVRLLQHMESAPEFITPEAVLPAHDAHCPIMSLPLALGLKGHPALFNTPYLAVDTHDLEYRRDQLSIAKERHCIGLAWRGSALHSNDKQRSLPLDQLLAMLPLGPSYVVLQKDVSPQEQYLLAERPDVMQIVEPTDDFYDTAALCCLMDLVICVDTSIVHLAGALGCPVLLMLAQPCDWRWQPNLTPNPWYGSVEILRQRIPGDWRSVLERLQQKLQYFAT